MPESVRAGTLCLGWGGQQVDILVTTAEARAAVETMFGAFLDRPRGNSIAHLTIRHGWTGYVVTDERERNTVFGPLPEVLRHVRYWTSRQFMAARPDLLWIHGAAVAQDRLAVLITGPGGCGKSTLATSLVDRGFSYLGDDLIPLDVQTGEVFPFPVSPTVRRYPGHLVKPEVVRTLPKVEVPLAPASIASAPVPVALVVFPVYEPGIPRALPWSRSETALELLRQCVDFPNRSADIVQQVSRVAPTWPALRLVFDDADRATAMVGEAHASATVPHRMSTGPL